MAFKAGAIYGEARLDTKKWNTGLKSIKRGAIIAGAAIAAAFAAAFVVSVKAADKFQKAMANVSTLVDTAVVDMQKLSKEVLLLSPALGGATELTKGLYQAFSAGAKTAEEAMKITTDSAKFAKAALTDTLTAVDILTTAVNAYGKEVMDTTKASDIFFQTIKYGKITGEELGSAIGTSIPLFASAGIELKELAAGMAAMTKQGVKANKATTQLNSIVMMFLKPSEDMIKALEDMDYASGSAFLKAEGLAGALKLLEERTKGDSAELAKLLPNVRALRGAMALTGVGGEEFTKILGEMEVASGVTQVAFDKQEKTFDTLRSAMGRVSIVIGNIGKHFVDKLAVGATAAAQGTLAFIMSAQGMELVADIIGTVAGGFTLLKEIIKPIVETLFPVLSEISNTIAENLIKVTGETTSSAGGFKILSIAVNMSTTAIVILGKFIEVTINTIGDFIVAIKESSQTIGTFFDFLIGKAKWKDVEANASSAGEALKNLVANQVGYVKEIFTTVTSEFKEFSNDTEELATDLNIKVSTSFNNAYNYTKKNWGVLTTGQEGFIADMLAGINKLSSGIKDIVYEGTEADKNIWFDMWDELLEKGEKTYKELKAFLDVSLENSFISLKTHTELSRELWTDNWDKQIETVQLAFDTITAITSTSFEAMAAIRSQVLTNESAELELAYQSDLSALDLKLQNEIITQEQYNTAKEELDEKYKDKKNELAEKVFEADKKNKVLGVFSDAASAIMGWWVAASKLGPFAGPIFAGFMTGLTGVTAAVQASLIAKQKFVPAMVEGGTASGFTKINERGGEILNLPGGTIVIPNDISREIARAGGSSGPTINISFDGAKISNDMDLDYVTDVVIKKLGREMRLAL